MQNNHLLTNRETAGLSAYRKWCGADEDIIDLELLTQFADHRAEVVKGPQVMENLYGLHRALEKLHPDRDHSWMEKPIRERWMESPARKTVAPEDRKKGRRPRTDSIPEDEWPAEYRDLWFQARSPKRQSLRELVRNQTPISAAVSWSPATVKNRCYFFGQYLARCKAAGIPSTITPEAIAVFLDAYRDGTAPRTMVSATENLLAMARVFHPDQDWSWLRGKVKALGHCAKILGPKRVRGERLLPLRDLRKLGRSLIAEARRSPKRRPSAATYMRGLLILFLSYHPVRRRNLAGMVVAEMVPHSVPSELMGVDHLIEQPDGTMVCVWPSTKNGSARVESLALPLVPIMREWQSIWRPVLASDLSGAALWLSSCPGSIGGQVTPQSLSVLIAESVKKHLRVRITAHDFRNIAATTIVEFAPHLVGTLPALLHHNKPDSCRHYIQAARSAGAARIFEAVVQKIANPRPPDIKFQRRTRRFLLGRASGRKPDGEQ